MRVALKRKTVIENTVPLYFMIDDKTGYIKLEQFLRGTTTVLKQAVMQLRAQGMQKLVLDIRGNIGGLVREATDCAGLFLPKNTLVCSIRMKDSTRNYTFNTMETPIDTVLPIVLITDKNTISSGEIFAGCLKDYHRATLIGQTTWGKGFVQSTYYMKNGSILYLTDSRYYTPAGYFIGSNGVNPDIITVTTDSIASPLNAILKAGIIRDFCILYRNTIATNFASNEALYAAFKVYYKDHWQKVKLPEEDMLNALSSYKTFNAVKRETEEKKKRLVVIYKTEIAIELNKEMLKQDYDYNGAGKMAFTHSTMYNILKAHQLINQ